MKPPFIDKSKARTFVLVHSTAGDKEGGGRRVFKEVTKPDVDESVFEAVGTLVDSGDKVEEYKEDDYYSEEDSDWNDTTTEDGEEDITETTKRRSELEDPLHYGVYFDDNYDYMQHMKTIGTTREAVFIPAAFGTSKGATAKASVDSFVLRADLPSDTNVGGTLEEEPFIDVDLVEELDLALEDEAYIDNDEIDFFDAIVGGTGNSKQRENNIRMVREKPQIIPILAENRKQQDNGPPKVKFALPSDQQLDEILKEYEDEAISLEDSLKTHSFENKGDANDAGSVLNDQHFDSILDQFLNENRGYLAERPFKASPVESPSCPIGTKLGKKDRMFSRAVEEMDALRHALEGVRIVPTNYRFELGSNEEEEIDSEQSLCELKDWNPTDETLEEFSSSTAFFSLIDEETPRMISNLPKTIREIPSLKVHTRKSASSDKSTAAFMPTPEPECVSPKDNLGKARPKEESPVEKKARKLAAKALKKKIPVSIK